MQSMRRLKDVAGMKQTESLIEWGLNEARKNDAANSVLNEARLRQHNYN